MVLLQREDADFAPVNPSPFAVNAEPSRVYEDPYNPNEMDPLKTKALESCLWEIKSLTRHYLSHVATMAKIFSEVFTKPEFVMEDFLDHSYASVSDFLFFDLAVVSMRARAAPWTDKRNKKNLPFDSCLRRR
jgi:hypothetical protein